MWPSAPTVRAERDKDLQRLPGAGDGSGWALVEVGRLAAGGRGDDDVAARWAALPEPDRGFIVHLLVKCPET